MTPVVRRSTHAEEIARRYAHYIQGRRQNTRTDTLGVRTYPSATLGNRDLPAHKSMYGQKPTVRLLCERWLVGVVEAMNQGELEHPQPAPWDLQARTEEIRVNSEDRPADEWDNIVRRNGVRHRDRRIHRDAWGNVSER